MHRTVVRVTAIAAVLSGLALSLLAGTGGGALPRARAASLPAFVSEIDNPYFPLPVGRLLVYKGVRDGKTQVDRVFVTDRTKVIQGVTATVVRDVAKHNGMLIEKTRDWFAQDVDGNVWYFGENTAEYDESGNIVSTEGSWEAGVDGAVAGITMLADPQVADGYRQEYYAGHAEDQAWILTRGTSTDVPYGHVAKVLRTMEWTRLEPRVIDQKYYGAGLGIIREVAVAGGDEFAELVNVVDP